MQGLITSNGAQVEAFSSTSDTAVTANMAKVYSPTVDLANPMGRNPAAVMSVPVSMGMAVTSQVKVAARIMS